MSALLPFSLDSDEGIIEHACFPVIGTGKAKKYRIMAALIPFNKVSRSSYLFAKC